MSRIFITGDTHGTHDLFRFSSMNFKERRMLTKDDYLIITGDFGGVWSGIKSVEQIESDYGVYLDSDKQKKVDLDAYTLLQYQFLPCTILFVDGNHENFDQLNSYQIKEWNGGNVHFIRKDIIHLMRGQVYNICGKKFFTMGGATSVDKYNRIEHKSWWKEELPTKEECEMAMANLDKHNWEVDYVITHAAPDNILHKISPSFEHDIITNFLFIVDKDLKFKDWYFGHYHIDKDFSYGDGEKYHCLYERIIELNLND